MRKAMAGAAFATAAIAGVALVVLPPRPVATRPARQCPDLTKLRGICSVVYERARAPDDSGIRFEYERYMRDAACANTPPLNSEQNLAKLRKLWAEHPQSFKCDSNDFDVTNGSLLKYSISSRSLDFANSALKWKLDLNVIDSSDGRTPLDYLYRDIERNKGTDMEPQLWRYLDAYRQAGAKFRCELEPERSYVSPPVKPVLHGVAVCP